MFDENRIRQHDYGFERGAPLRSISRFPGSSVPGVTGGEKSVTSFSGECADNSLGVEFVHLAACRPTCGFQTCERVASHNLA